MPDIFLSYSREDQATARRYAEAFQSEGFEVWWDVTLRSGENYDQVTEKALRDAKAVVVLWSATSVESRWVRAEATQANRNKTLVPAMIEACERPIMFELTQTAELMHWRGDARDPAWQMFLADVRRFVERKSAAAVAAIAPAPLRPQPALKPENKRLSVCVLPFANMSGDAEQEYFSDGISEDIITDLSKVSALGVVSRNTAFTFKGKIVKAQQVARELNVSHVLEGSVRKAGNRVRITAQLINGTNDEHVWAERYDRDLSDIFALQDEISKAIVKALQVTLLPEEKKAIERRGTDSVEAYNIYLMARQEYVSGRTGDTRPFEALVRLCRRAIEIDPGYAQAWALMAQGQMWLRYMLGGSGDGGLAATERALALDDTLPEAHAVKARILAEAGQYEEATAEIDRALQLNPESHESNETAARLLFRQKRFKEAVVYWERAVTLMDMDCGSPAMLTTCYRELNMPAETKRSAEITLERVEKILAQDRNNGAALGHGSAALATLGQGDRAKAWMNRALLIDPDNLNMRYNFACSLATYLNDSEGALDMLENAFGRMGTGLLNHTKVDPDFDSIRENPRFKAMMASAEARLAKEGGKPL